MNDDPPEIVIGRLSGGQVKFVPPAKSKFSMEKGIKEELKIGKQPSVIHPSTFSK